MTALIIGEKQEKILNEILDIAEAMMLDVGISQFSLNTLVKESKIARNTFYKYVTNKETLIAYLAIRGLNKMLAFAERGKLVDGMARIKFVGVYTGFTTFIELNPLFFECVMHTNGNRLTINQATKLMFDNAVEQIVKQIQWCIELAMYNQEVTIPSRLVAFDLAYYIWTSYIGIFSASISGKENAVVTAHKYWHYERITLDAWPWHPTSTEVDYDQITEQIKKEIFV